MKKVSEQFLDRPLTPLDTAIYWIEYVIKHGENALRSPAMDLRWWQLEMLDVAAILLLVAVIIGAVLIVVLRYLFSLANPILDVSVKKKIS